MNVLITGATGFLATNILNKLPSTFNVFAITSAPNFISDKYDNVQCYTYSDLYSNNIEFDKFECIIHCGFARNSNPIHLAESLNFTNKLVSQVPKNSTMNFINISSQSVYDSQRKEIANEESLVKPLTLYAMAKYSSEKIIESNFDKTNINYTNLRLASLTGEGFEYRLTDKFVKSIINNQPIIINGGGNQVISYLDGYKAAEIIYEIIRISEKNKIPEVCNVGVKDNYRLIELARVCQKIGIEYGYLPQIEVVNSEDFSNNSLDVGLLSELVNINLDWDLDRNIRELFEKYKG